MWTVVCKYDDFHTLYPWKSVSVFITRIIKPPKVIFCDLLRQIMYNYIGRKGSHCDAIGHRKMEVLSMAGEHGDNLDTS